MKAKEAIRILRYIPEDEFTTRKFEEGIQCCSLGWLNLFTTGSSMGNYENDRVLRVNAMRFLDPNDTKYLGFTSVNDNRNDSLPPRYSQIKSIKQRVLTFLRDMDKAGY